MDKKAKHTPGPWYVNEHPFTNQDEYILAKPGKTGDDCRDVVAIAQVEQNKNVLLGHRTKDETRANAARIVACVNACEGIEDPAELRAQRDELLRSAKQVLEALSAAGQSRSYAAPALKAAIARAEGRKKGKV